MSEAPRPSALDYEDWRAFLRDIVDWLQAHDPTFSLRKFARDSGFKSHTHLGKVLDGKIGLTAESASGYAQSLALTEQETLYFTSLAIGDKVNIIVYGSDRNNYLDLMVLACLREAETRFDPDRVSAMTRGLVTSSEVREVMAYFKAQGLLEENAGGWSFTDKCQNTFWLPENYDDAQQTRDMLAVLQRIMPTDALKTVGGSFYVKANPEDIKQVMLKVQSALREELSRIGDLGKDSSHARLYGVYIVSATFEQLDAN